MIELPCIQIKTMKKTENWQRFLDSYMLLIKNKDLSLVKKMAYFKKLFENDAVAAIASL